MKLLGVLFILILSTGCFQEKGSGGLIWKGQSNNLAVSRAAFRGTVFPIVSNCATCHDGSEAAPNFSTANSDGMHDYMTNRGLITPDPSVASSSRLVRKVRDSKHNCGTDPQCLELGAALQTAVTRWAEQAQSGTLNVGNYVTDSVNIANNLRARLPETYRGTLLVQAEDLLGTGPGERWKVDENPNASGRFFITTRDSDVNPLDQTERQISIDGSMQCQTIESYNSGRSTYNINVNGAVRYSEQRRHPSQNTGHIPYRHELRAAVVHPLMRAQFVSFIANNPNASLAQVNPFLLKDDDVDPATVLTPQFQLIGDVVSFPVMDMLPPVRNGNGYNYVTSEMYQGQGGNVVPNGNINNMGNLNIQDANYFARNWGNVEGRTFAAQLNHSDVAAMIPQREVQQRVYRELYNFYHNQFFDGNVGRSQVELFYLRGMPDPNSAGGFELFGFTPGPNRVAFTIEQAAERTAQAIRFLNFWLYQRNVNVLTHANAHQNINQFVFYFFDNQVDEGDSSFSLYNDNSNYSGVAPIQRSFSTAGTQEYRLDFGMVNLDLTSILMAPEINLSINQAAIRANWDTHVHPVINQNSAAMQAPGVTCLECHGNAGDLPRWASTNPEVSYSVFSRYANSIFTNSYVPLNPANMQGNPQLGDPDLRILHRPVNERHECLAATCDTLAENFATAINNWHQANQPLFNTQVAPIITSLAVGERQPARAYMDFKVPVGEGGNYALWLKFLTRGNQDQRVVARILDSQGRPMRVCDYDEECPTTNATFQGQSPIQVDRMNCETNNFTQNVGDGFFYWYVDSYDDFNNRKGWQLEGGQVYRLEIVENQTTVGLDLIALSKDPTFDPRTKTIDESYIAKVRPESIEWDISQFTGQQSKFRVDITVTDDAYIVTNPTLFAQGGRGVQVSALRVLLNGAFDFTNATFLLINEITDYRRDEGADLLTTTEVSALKVRDEHSDSISMGFDTLSSTDHPPTDNRWTAPPDGIDVTCNYPTIFGRIVQPILTGTNIMLFGENVDDSYDDVIGEFPGRNGENGARNQTLYRACTTCHTENHPYLKMTQLLGNNDPQGTARLCGQILSRSRGSTFPWDDLKIFKMLDLHPGHPTVVPIEYRRPYNNSTGNDYNFINGQGQFVDNPSNFRWQASTSIYSHLSAYEKYTQAEVDGWINANNWNNTQDNYCREWVGKPKVIRFQRYQDPFNPTIDDERIALGDIYRAPTSAEIGTAASPGPLYTTYISNPNLMLLERSNPATYNRTNDVTCADMVANNECLNFNGRREDVPNNCFRPEHVGTGGVLKATQACYTGNTTVCNDQNARNAELVSIRATVVTQLKAAIKEWLKMELDFLGE